MVFQFLQNKLLFITKLKPFASLITNTIIIYGLSFFLRFINEVADFIIIILCLLFFSINCYIVFKNMHKKDCKKIIIFISTYLMYFLNIVLNFYYESVMFQNSELSVFPHILLKVICLCPVIGGIYIINKTVQINIYGYIRL